jgi:hypothetical protein
VHCLSALWFASGWKRGLRVGEARSDDHAARQGLLGRYIGSLRDQTAKFTDERVRLEGEAISGVLAMKVR